LVQNRINRLDAAFPVAAAVALDIIRRGEVRGRQALGKLGQLLDSNS